MRETLALIIFRHVDRGERDPAQLARDLERVRLAIDARLGRKPTAGIFHSMSARTP